MPAAKWAPALKSFSTIFIFVVGLLGAYGVSEFMVANDWTGLSLVVIGIVGLVFAVKILNNWRHGLYIFFGWLFVEDFARKYLGNNMAIFFAKDFLVVLVYISYYVTRKRKAQRVTFTVPF